MGHYSDNYESDAIEAQQSFNKYRKKVISKINKILNSDDFAEVKRCSDDACEVRKKLQEAIFWLEKL